MLTLLAPSDSILLLLRLLFGSLELAITQDETRNKQSSTNMLLNGILATKYKLKCCIVLALTLKNQLSRRQLHLPKMQFFSRSLKALYCEQINQEPSLTNSIQRLSRDSLFYM